MEVLSKKQINNGKGNNYGNEIVFVIPYGSNNVFFQQSGGTTLALNTINQAAADEFIVGESYDIVISPSAKAEPVLDIPAPVQEQPSVVEEVNIPDAPDLGLAPEAESATDTPVEPPPPVEDLPASESIPAQ